MKSHNYFSLVYHFWLLILPDYSTCSDLKQPSSEKSIGKTYSKKRIQGAVSWNNYCRDHIDAEEVEELFYMDKESEMLRQVNWWRSGFTHTEVKVPLCARPPNAKMSPKLTAKISDHQFFKNRKIDIPILEGEKRQSELNEFRHSERKARHRHILVCTCVLSDEKTDSSETSGEGTQVALKREKVCIDGKIYLSKGVGGDESFFVHMPVPKNERKPTTVATEGSVFKVVAHLCF